MATATYEKHRSLVLAELRVGIAAQLYNRRIELGLSEQEVADRMGSTQAKVSEFEQGEANATYDYVARYAAAVGMMPKIEFRKVKKLPTDKVPPDRPR